MSRRRRSSIARPKRFRDTDGDLREVVRTIVTSTSSSRPRGAKVKTPLEFVVSAHARDRARLPGDGRQLLQALQQIGMPLYMCQPPTGYDDTADTWVSAGALVTRMNFAQRIAGPRQAASDRRPRVSTEVDTKVTQYDDEDSSGHVRSTS